MRAGVAGCIILAACGGVPQGEVPEQSAIDSVAPGPGPSPQLSTFAYRCEEAGYVVANHPPGGDSLWLFLPDTTVSLALTTTASGARYTVGSFVWWTKGNEAILEVSDGEYRCSEMRRRSIIEDAKLRGADFWASGNEPGWRLEVFPDRVRLIGNYGADLLVFPATAWQDGERAASTMTSSILGHRLELTLMAETDGCRDSMSGDRFETTVVLQLDDTTLRGCGQALH